MVSRSSLGDLKPLGIKTKKWDGKGAEIGESGTGGQGNKTGGVVTPPHKA